MDINAYKQRNAQKLCVLFFSQFHQKDVTLDDDDTLTQSWQDDFLVGGLTFEKLGLIMKDSKCQPYRHFDEARMLLPQLCL